jgi:response regulator RpfG family c-di-GMP phosphodiesterase
MESKAPKRILLVEDEEVILEALKKFLEKHNYKVTTVTNGKLARDLMGFDPFDLVISDIHMPGSPISGVELLAFVKNNMPGVPVVLMTGFATLAETKDAYTNGAAAFLAKPFDRNELLKTVQKLFHVEVDENKTPDEIDEDENYSKISIDDFVSGKEIKFSVFVRLSKSKYIKVAHQGEDLDIERVRIYKQKGMQFLYLTRDDFLSYMKQSLGLALAVRASPKIENGKKMRFLKHTGEVIFEHIYSSEINKEVFDNAKMIMETTLSFVTESQQTFDLVDSLNQHSDYLYAHSLGVSLYSVMIAKKMEWFSTPTAYKLSMGGLLHDIGKKEIDPALLLKPRSAYTAEEVKLIETHPVRGMELLSHVSTISDDVLQIVLQNHERDNGTGYPQRLMKSKIHPLARVVSVADEFCKLVIDGPDRKRIAPLQAVDRLVALYGSTIDAGFIGALRKIAS